MKLVRWKRFTWDLSKLPPLGAALPTFYQVRGATRDEHKIVRDVIVRAFSLDTDWSDIFARFQEKLEDQLEHAFRHEQVPAVVIAHGPRIIAASGLCTEAGAESHLLSGPCVLMEYRSRGIGSALLHHSLKQLQAAGLPRACGICKDTAPTAKFVYPKFGSTSEVTEFEPAVLHS
jgi:predicted N-acetyltransferase YhbS